MKICYILPEYSPNTDSHFYHIYEFLEKISKKLDIFLIVEKSETKNIGLGKKEYVQRLRFLPLRFLESFLAVLKARILGYKTFYTHYCYIGGINAGIISRLTGGKSYYWHCEMIWEFKQKFLSKIGLNLSLKLSHFLVTGSEKMKEGYSQHYKLIPEKIKVMPNWVNLNRFNQLKLKTQNSELKTLLFVHWLAERKGAHLIVPIILAIKSGFSNFKLLVIGEGPCKEKLLREIRENKLEKFIQVIGKIPNKELVEYYAMADVFILPSTREGFPRVLLEAMAIGIPYVAFDVGAVREISPSIAQNFLLRAGDIEGFANKIKILLSDGNIYEKFREEELEEVKKYSLDKIVDRFIKLFL